MNKFKSLIIQVNLLRYEKEYNLKPSEQINIFKKYKIDPQFVFMCCTGGYESYKCMMGELLEVGDEK